MRVLRYTSVVRLTNEGWGTKEIAAHLGCCKDLVRHYRRIARRAGINLKPDPWFVNVETSKRNEGNEKWKALKG